MHMHSHPHILTHSYTHTHTHTSGHTWVVCVSEPLHEPLDLSHDGVQTSHLHLHGLRGNVNNVLSHIGGCRPRHARALPGQATTK